MSRSFTKEMALALKQPRHKLEWLGEALALAALLAQLIVLAVHYGALPARIATHYGLAGLPDGWGSKSILLLLLGINVAIYVLIAAVYNKPRLYNFPVQITPENAQRQYLMARYFMLVIKVAVCWMLFYITFATVNVALGRAAGLGWGMFVFLAVLVILLPLMIWLSYKRR